MENYIVAIGGGEISNRETETIDRIMVSLSKKEKKQLLFIPTASHDSSGYAAAVSTYFSKLGCTVESLYLTRNKYSEKDLKQLILGADFIYVGGGDTAYMMKLWKQSGVDQMLVQAYKQGVILSGLSAGAICWAFAGHSDSESFHSAEWSYSKVYGLGLIPAILCPHYNEEGRENFDLMLRKEHAFGIALENQTALLKKNDSYRILREDISCKAYWIWCSESNEIMKTEIEDGWFQFQEHRLWYL